MVLQMSLDERPVAFHQIALKSGKDRQIELMESELERVKAERDRLRLALGKAARILHSDALIQQHQIAALHGFPYRGEMFTEEEYAAACDGDTAPGTAGFKLERPAPLPAPWTES